jgi:hypothetical protein
LVGSSGFDRGGSPGRRCQATVSTSKLMPSKKSPLPKSRSRKSEILVANRRISAVRLAARSPSSRLRSQALNRRGALNLASTRR